MLFRCTLSKCIDNKRHYLAYEKTNAIWRMKKRMLISIWRMKKPNAEETSTRKTLFTVDVRSQTPE